MIATLNNKTKFNRRKITFQDINNNPIKKYDKYCSISNRYDLRIGHVLLPQVNIITNNFIDNSSFKFIYLRNVSSDKIERRIMDILKPEPKKELIITVK